MEFTIFSLACPDKSHGPVGLVDPQGSKPIAVGTSRAYYSDSTRLIQNIVNGTALDATVGVDFAGSGPRFSNLLHGSPCCQGSDNWDYISKLNDSYFLFFIGSETLTISWTAFEHRVINC